MKLMSWRRVLLMVALAGSLGTGLVSGGESASYADPTKFEKDVCQFERNDEQRPPPRQAVLCVGSSTMRIWHDTIHQDLAPLTVVARGFGGSTMNDLLHYVERLVIAYQPRAVVIYEGDNDVAQGISPPTIHETYRALIRKIHQRLPEARVYFISIKPSSSRWTWWETAQRVNDLIAKDCAGDARMTCIDISSHLLNADGKVRDELYQEDQLHLNRSGYETLREIVRPVLLEKELSYERSEELLVR